MFTDNEGPVKGHDEVNRDGDTLYVYENNLPEKNSDKIIITEALLEAYPGKRQYDKIIRKK